MRSRRVRRFCILLVSLGLGPSVAIAEGRKVDICHIPPDNPDNVRPLRVGENAAGNHIFAHGDFEVGVECFEGIGECMMAGETVCVADDDVCTASPLSPAPEDPELSCEDGLDNDCDGLTDGDDPDCQAPGCPCLDVWDGAPYPAGTSVATTPPTLPVDLTSAQCRIETYESETTVSVAGGSAYFSAETHTLNDLCTAQDFDNVGFLGTPPAALFPDTIPGSQPEVGSPMYACVMLLEDRGCVFQ